MRKICCCFIYLSLCLPFAEAAADTHSDELLAKLSAKIASLGNYRVGFVVEAEGNRVEGEYVVSRDRYYMEVGDAEVICDGKTKYEINHADMEVVADKVDSNDKNIFSNPATVFDFASDNFTSEYLGESMENGVKSDVVMLRPSQKGSGIAGITIAIDRSKGLPVSLTYDADGLSDEIRISITGFASDPAVKDSLFNFDRKKYKEYEFIDFR